MKKIKKAYGKGGEGIKNLGSAAVKTVIGATLSQQEKATLHHIQGRDAVNIVFMSQDQPEVAPVINLQINIMPQQPLAAPHQNPPSFDEVMGAHATVNASNLD